MSHWQSKSLAKSYSEFRPRYPRDLFQHVLRLLPSAPRTIIDLGCGSGQAIDGFVKELLPQTETHFIGIDTSAAQLEQAKALQSKCILSLIQGDASSANFLESMKPPMKQQASAESKSPPLLVVSAQALHWMKMDQLTQNLFQIAHHCGHSNIMFAAWNYGTLTLENPSANAVLRDFDELLLANKMWPSERLHVVDNYSGLNKQLMECGWRHRPDALKRFPDRRVWSLERLVAYLSTWSGLQRFVASQRAPAADDSKSILTVEQVLEERIAAPIRKILSPPSAGSKDSAVDLQLSFYYNLHVFEAHQHLGESQSKL